MHDLNEPAFNRLIHYRKTVKVGKAQKVVPMTKRAETVAKNKLIKYPEHIQSSMVSKCIDNNWETVWPLGGTLDYDDKDVEKPNYPQPPEIIRDIVDNLVQPIPDEREPLEQLYGTSKEDSKKIADRERKRLKDMLL